MSKLLQIALNELGVKEIAGDEHHVSILNYARETGFEWIDDDETPWCSVFMNWVARKAGKEETGKATARSWLSIGKNVDEHPLPGDVVVFWRGSRDSWKGHVGLFFGYSKSGNKVYCLGGNQGNAVSISAYPVNTILGFRRIEEIDVVHVPDVVLRRADRGNEVRALQEALHVAGFPCGTVDGIFGSKTEDAVKEMQRITKINVDGVFGPRSRTALLQVLGE